MCHGTEQLELLFPENEPSELQMNLCFLNEFHFLTQAIFGAIAELNGREIILISDRALGPGAVFKVDAV